MNKFKITLCLLFFTSFSFGQTTDKIFNSIETSFELGLGGATYGFQAKVNHNWLENDRITVMSSLSFSSFWGNINNYTQYYPSLEERTDISGFTTDNHLRVYSGIRLAFFKKRKGFITVEGYFGGYHAYMNGNYFHERLQINQDYAAGQSFFDYGSRLGVGYKINDKLSIQGTLNNSLRQLGYGYRLLPTVYQYNPDNKMSLGVGAAWSLN